MKKTSWFAVFVALLVGATYYFEFYRVAKEENKKNEAAKIVPLALDQVHQLEVENSHGKILLKRDVEGWRLEHPVKDWADNQFTEDFINGLGGEKSLETITSEKNLDWQIYGLDKGTANVVFADQQGKSVLIRVSAKKNFEGNSFLRRGDENQVLIGSSQWTTRSQQSALDFRDKRFYRGKIGSVDEIHVKNSKDDFKLVKKENQWLSEKHPEIKLDQNRVREVLTSLNEIRAQEFLQKVPATAKLQSRIEIRLGDKSWVGQVFEAPDKVIYGRTSDPEFELKLSASQVGKFATMTLMGLRDHREPFDFKNLMVRRIEIETPLKKTHFVKEKETWQIEGDPKASLDQAAFRNMIMRLSDSAVTEYLEKSEQAAFKNPENRLVLRDEKQQLLFDLRWGTKLKKKNVTGERELILAQSNLYKDVFGLEPSVIESWDLMRLLPVEQTKEKTSKDQP